MPIAKVSLKRWRHLVSQLDAGQRAIAIDRVTDRFRIAELGCQLRTDAAQIAMQERFPALEVEQFACWPTQVGNVVD